MQKFLLVFFFFTAKSILGQTIEIENIKEGTHIISDKNIIIVVGHNYNIDGYGQTSSINAYDTALNFKWTFTIDSSHTNTIDNIKIFDKKIIFTGLVGKRDNKNLNTIRYIKILNSEGKLLLNKNIGASHYQCSNLTIKNNTLFFCYLKPQTTLFSEILSKSKNIVYEYNLITNKIKTKDYILPRSFAKYFNVENNKFFIIGEQHSKQLDSLNKFIKIIPNKRDVFLLPRNNENLETFYKVVKNNLLFTLVSFSNQYKENKYIKFESLNFDGKLISTKFINFENLGWQKFDYSYKIFCDYPSSIENELWFYAYKFPLEASFVRLNENGEQIENIKSNISKGSCDFYTTTKCIYHLYKENEKIKLTKIIR